MDARDKSAVVTRLALSLDFNVTLDECSTHVLDTHRFNQSQTLSISLSQYKALWYIPRSQFLPARFRDETPWPALPSLLLPFVDLIQETLEDRALQLHFALLAQASLWDRANESHDALVGLLFVHCVLLPYANCFEHRLHAFLRLCVLLAIIRVQHCTLLGSSDRERGVDAPRALVVNDVRPDLANLLRCACEVQVVVLDLEVLAERKEDGRSERVRVLPGCVVRDAAQVHGKCHGQIEGVVCGLVEDDETVPVDTINTILCTGLRYLLLKRELAEVDLVLGSSDEIE